MPPRPHLPSHHPYHGVDMMDVDCFRYYFCLTRGIVGEAEGEAEP